MSSSTVLTQHHLQGTMTQSSSLEAEDHAEEAHRIEQLPLPPSLPTKSNICFLVCAFLAALTTGATTYAFGFYANALKASLSLTQSELDTISAAAFTAGLMSWIPGLCVDFFGSRTSCFLGGIMSSVLLTGYWLVARRVLVVNHVVATLSLMGVGVFICSALVTGSVFKIIVTYCGPGSKGLAVGVAKGYVGLGSGVYTVLFEAMKASKGGFNSDMDFLPMAAFFSFSAAALPALCLLPSNAAVLEFLVQDSTTRLHFRILYLGLLALAVLVMGKSMIELFLEGNPQNGPKNDNDTPDFLMTAFVLLLWWGPPICLFFVTASTAASDGLQEPGLSVLKEGKAETESDAALSKDIVFEEEELVALQSTEANHAEGEQQGAITSPKDRNLTQMLTTIPAWLMLWTTVMLVGGGTMMTNQMGEMAEALSFDESVGKASLALFSVSQSFARVVTGAVSEWALEWKVCGHDGIPRVAFFVVASALGGSAHLLLAIATTEVPFVLGVAMSGLAFGMVWPLMVLVTGEMYGKRFVGGNYMFYDGVTSAVGTLLLSKFVAQVVYEDHIVPGPDGKQDTTCLGEGCFQPSHFVVAGLAGTCVITSVCLMFTRLSNETYDVNRGNVTDDGGRSNRSARDYENVLSEEI